MKSYKIDKNGRLMTNMDMLQPILTLVPVALVASAAVVSLVDPLLVLMISLNHSLVGAVQAGIQMHLAEVKTCNTGWT